MGKTERQCNELGKQLEGTNEEGDLFYGMVPRYVELSSESADEKHADGGRHHGHSRQYAGLILSGQRSNRTALYGQRSQ